MNKFSIILAVSLLFAGCSLFPPAYKTPVSQGNVLKQEDVEQLKIGMTGEQVKFLIGSPAVNDPLTPNTWHYLFTAPHTDDNTEISEIDKLILTFENGQLISIKKN